MSSSSSRSGYLDDIRVFLTVLVILHHIAVSYGPPGVWYYNEPVSGPGSLLAFAFLMAINQAFFMGFFFLLAGYFVPPSLARKGPAYTVYIVHPIVLVLLALALRNLPVPSFTKFLLTAPVAVVVLFASAPYIRRAPLLRQVL